MVLRMVVTRLGGYEAVKPLFNRFISRIKRPDS